MLNICGTVKELYEILQRNGNVLPKQSSVLVNTEYLRKVYQKMIWVPHQLNLKWRNCPRPPTMVVLVDKLLALAEIRGFETGIVKSRKNFPDQQWILLSIATLNPLDEIFERTYLPPSAKALNVAPEVLVEPQEGVFEGMENIFAGQKRSKRGMASAILSRDDMLAKKIEQKQARIQAQVAQT